MKIKKKITFALALVLTLSIGTITLAAPRHNAQNAEVLANLTGKTVEELVQERYNSGKTYGQLAEEYGVYDKFRAETLNNKKSILDQRVKDGTLSQKDADTIYNRMKENQENNTGYMGPGSCGAYGMGLGMGRGRGRNFQENNVTPNNEAKPQGNTNGQRQNYTNTVVVEEVKAVNNGNAENVEAPVGQGQGIYRENCDGLGLGQGQGQGRGQGHGMNIHGGQGLHCNR